MKKIMLILVLIGSLAFADSAVKMEIGGMTCDGCASGIEESFTEDLPKYKVHVNYKTAIMTVSTQNGSDVNVNEVKTALEELGFKGTLMKKPKHGFSKCGSKSKCG